MDAGLPHTRAVHATPKNAASDMPNGAAASVTKRLGNELMQMMMSSSPGISAFPKSESNLFEWVGTIEGAPGTVYTGLVFKVSITFPSNYPYAPPVLKFASPCFHPNVDMSGNICLDILQDKWSAVYSAHTILLSLQSLLGEPNNSSPLNNEAAQLWANPAEFKTRLMSTYRVPQDE